MKRKDFRAYFDADPCDAHARFDRSGFAEIGLPWPELPVAKELSQYAKVKKLSLSIHEQFLPSAITFRHADRLGAYVGKTVD